MCFVLCFVSLFCVLYSGSVFVSYCVRHPQIILIQLMSTVSSYIFLLALVLLECQAQSIVCGSGTIILTVGVQSNITCTGIRRNPTITPVLPVGLTYSNGRIQGTPVDGLPLTTYTIVDRNNYGTFTLGSRFSLSFSSLVIGNPTSISSGFNAQTVFSNIAIVPIRFVGNTVFTSYSISPALPASLSLNTTSGVISGTYTGAAASTIYQVTGTNTMGSISTAFTLNYKGSLLPLSFTPSAERGQYRGLVRLLLLQHERLQPLLGGVVLLRQRGDLPGAGDAGPDRQLQPAVRAHLAGPGRQHHRSLQRHDHRLPEHRRRG